MLITLEPTNTYATRENAIKAADKKFSHLRYIIVTHTDGRFFPVFLGEKAIQAGAHFHFCVVN